MIQSLLLGIVGGLASAFLFMLALSQIRPRLRISEVIAIDNIDGKPTYSIKVVNVGSRKAIHLRAELFIVGPRVVKGGAGKGRVYYKVPLLKHDFFMLKPHSAANGEMSSYNFSTEINLKAAWTRYAESYLLLLVTAQDDFTSFSKCFEMRFETPQQAFKVGRFGFGKDMLVYS